MGNEPEIRWSLTKLRHVQSGRITTLLLHGGTFPWAEDLVPGEEFSLWAASKGSGEHFTSRVRVTAICRHETATSIPACPSGHAPERVGPGKTGWVRLIREMCALGEQGNGDCNWKRTEPWTVVDFDAVVTQSD